MNILKLGHAVQKNTHKLTKKVLEGLAEATGASEEVLSGITELTEQEFSDTLKMARLAEGKTGKALNAIETIPIRNEITEAVSASTTVDNTISFNKFFKQAKAGLNIEDRAGATNSELRPIFKEFYDSGITDAEKAIAKYNETKVAINAAVDAASNGTEKVVSIKPIGKKTAELQEEAAQRIRAEQLKNYKSPDSPYGSIDTEGLPEHLREYKSPVSPYGNMDTELDDAITIANQTDDILYEQRAYRQQQVDNLSKIGQKPTEITASFDVPKSEGFTIDGPFPKIEAKTEPSFTLQSSGATGLGTNAAAFDQPILNANKGFDYSKFSTVPEVSRKKIITTAEKESGKFDSSNFTKALTGKNSTIEEANEQFAYGAKVALGAVTTFGVLSAALSSSRGQQNNAQLYGQQPIY